MYNEEEHGKWIPGYEGMYSVTKSGEVWSFKMCRSKSARKMTARPANRGGYPSLQLYRRKKRKLFYIHSLVAKTYIGPRPRGMEICHNNGDPLDNRLENLRYDTSSENNYDIIRHGRKMGPRRSIDKDTAKLIKAKLKQGGPLGFQSRLAKQYGLSPQLICDIKKGRVWTDV